VDLAPGAGGGRAVAPAADGGNGPGIGLLGAGSFATATLLPAIQAAGGFRFAGVATATGVSGHHVARKYGFAFATTDEREVLSDPAVQLVAILTRHDLHARQIAAALAAGKHVFCEKPPALDEAELGDVVRALDRAPGRLLAVGYNRRFSPMAVRMRELAAAAGEPVMIHCRVNAGPLPASHWLHDPAVGGGRIVGEGCHFVDLLSFLAGSLPVRVRAHGLPDGGRYREDNVALALDFADGSVGTITYVAAGDRALGKERVELFGGGAAAVLDDYRSLELHRGGGTQREKSRLRQDKGHRAEWEAIGRTLRGGGPPPIALESLVATSLATFAAVRSLRGGRTESVDAAAWLRELRSTEPAATPVTGEPAGAGTG
jgi:predicted dehydrogenase